MILSIAERLVLPELLPRQGNLIEMTLSESIERKVQFSAEEISSCGLKSADGTVTWDPASDAGKEVAFEPAELELLRECYRRIDAEKQVTKRNLSLCRKLRDL